MCASTRDRTEDLVVNSHSLYQRSSGGDAWQPYGTRDSHVVPHRSTDRAQRRLTSEF